MNISKTVIQAVVLIFTSMIWIIRLCFVKLFILLYADDTFIISESAVDLQNGLNAYKTHCDSWKMTLNTMKTKFVVFSGGRQLNYDFTYKNENIEVVKDYKYLGIMFSRSGPFLTVEILFPP